MIRQQASAFAADLYFETRRLGQSIIFRYEVIATPRIRWSDWKQASKPEDHNIYSVLRTE
jgi:hypothetical protein